MRIIGRVWFWLAGMYALSAICGQAQGIWGDLVEARKIHNECFLPGLMHAIQIDGRTANVVCVSVDATDGTDSDTELATELDLAARELLSRSLLRENSGKRQIECKGMARMYLWREDSRLLANYQVGEDFIVFKDQIVPATAAALNSPASFPEPQPSTGEDPTGNAANAAREVAGEIAECLKTSDYIKAHELIIQAKPPVVQRLGSLPRKIELHIAIAENKDLAANLTALGDLYYGEKDYAAAGPLYARFYDVAGPDDGAREKALYRLTGCLQETGDTNGIRERCREFLRKYPTSEFTSEVMGRLSRAEFGR